MYRSGVTRNTNRDCPCKRTSHNMFSSQKYFPIAIIDNRNELRSIEYNHGVEALTTSSIKGPLEASFSVENVKVLHWVLLYFIQEKLIKQYLLWASF